MPARIGLVDATTNGGNNPEAFHGSEACTDSGRSASQQVVVGVTRAAGQRASGGTGANPGTGDWALLGNLCALGFLLFESAADRVLTAVPFSRARWEKVLVLGGGRGLGEGSSLGAGEVAADGLLAGRTESLRIQKAIAKVDEPTGEPGDHLADPGRELLHLAVDVGLGENADAGPAPSAGAGCAG